MEQRGNMYVTDFSKVFYKEDCVFYQTTIFNGEGCVKFGKM